MHTCPWYYATELPNVPASNLVQIGIGGWQVHPPRGRGAPCLNSGGVRQVPRESLPNMRERGTDANVFTIGDIEEMGVEKVVEMALDIAWKDADAVPPAPPPPPSTTVAAERQSGRARGRGGRGGRAAWLRPAAGRCT